MLCPSALWVSALDPHPLRTWLQVAEVLGDMLEAFDNWDRLFGMNGAFQLYWEVGVPVSSSNWNAP